MKYSLLLVIFLSLNIFAQELNDMKLVWMPTDDINELKQMDISVLENKKIYIEKFKDERKVSPKNKVGENTEKLPAKPVLTSSDIPEFIRTNLALVHTG